MELVLIRHGLPERIETTDGSPADPPLSSIGEQQAYRMADWLCNEEFHCIYASPMRRAHQTAQPLAQRSDQSIHLDPGVAEYDVDSDVYIPVEELKQVDYPRWKALMEGGYDDPAGFAAFCDRVISSVEKMIADNPGKKIAIVCHGGVINVWTAHVIGFEPRLFFNPDYTSINRYMAASSGERSVISLNQAVHLHRTG
jgi:probable phosphoglycerate mutase